MDVTIGATTHHIDGVTSGLMIVGTGGNIYSGWDAARYEVSDIDLSGPIETYRGFSFDVMALLGSLTPDLTSDYERFTNLDDYFNGGNEGGSGFVHLQDYNRATGQSTTYSYVNLFSNHIKVACRDCTPVGPSAVPLPASAPLLGAGMVLFGLWRRRKLQQGV